MAKGEGSNMGQFSVEKPVAPGSALSGNQHLYFLKGSIPPFRFGGFNLINCDRLPITARRRGVVTTPVESELLHLGEGPP